MLDRYELLEVLGTGAFATVWKAHDPVLGTNVAIKVLADNWSRDMEMRQRFLSEARNALEVTNEHLIRVHHVAESQDDNRTPYIVMALAAGGTLEERNRQRRLLLPDVHDALRVIRDIAIAVAALHNNGLLHRDLKPANVLFQDTRSGGKRLVLGDFGLARAIDRSALTMVAGTPAYAAPEQAAGLTQLTPQADLYALGVMFLELVTGRLPTANDTMADTAINEIDIPAVLEPANVQLDPETAQLIDELLDPKPENRPLSAHQVATRINAILGENAHIPTYQPAAQPGVAAAAVQTAVPSAPVVDGAQSSPAPPLTPTAPPTLRAGEESNPPWAIIGSVLAGLVGLVVVLSIVLSGGGDDGGDSAAPTTSAVVQTEADEDEPDDIVEEATTTTEVTTTTGAPTTAAAGIDLEPSEEIPSNFPLPPAAILDAQRSNGSLLRFYNIAGTPDTVLAQYQEFGGWNVDNITQGEQIQFDVSNSQDRITVTAEGVPNTTGIDVTVFRVEPAEAG